jgi:hypothetical protein
MYVLAWTIGTGGSDPEGHEDHYEMFEDYDKAYERAEAIKEIEGLWSYNVSVCFDGSDPQHFDYRGMSRMDKARLCVCMASLIPEDYTAMDLGSTLLTVADPFFVSKKDVAEFFRMAADVAEIADADQGVIIQ